MGNVAKLAISIARKMNALIFLVPEDIVDVRAKLVRVFRHNRWYLSDIPLARFSRLLEVS